MKRSTKKSRMSAAAANEPVGRKASGARAPVAPARNRRWLFRLVAIFIVPLVVLTTLELGLRVAGYGYDPRFFKQWRIAGEDFLVQNDAFSFRFFPPQTVRHPGAVRMSAVKPTGVIRIFVLGESAAMGDPEPAFGPARYMEVLLGQRFPAAEFEVVNVAFTAINSNVILPIARECVQHDGDIWIIYMGNNEMVGPYGASSAFGLRAPPLTRIRLALALQRLRLGQVITDIVRRAGEPSSDFAAWGGMKMFLENQVAADDPRREVVRSNFRRNLDDIIQSGLDADARILLNTVAVNLKDSPPFASMTRSNLPAARRGLFQQRLSAAREAGASSTSLAAQRYAAVAKLEPTHAATQFEWASVLLQQTNVAAARDRFQNACDLDALAFRTDSHLNEVILETASRVQDPNLSLLDAVAALEAYGPDGITGSESFYEHVHFNFDGAYRLGLAWAQNVQQMLGDQLPEPASLDWASQAVCEDLLALTDWNRVLVLQSMIKRLQVPPLNSQPNNPRRIQLLQDQIHQLKTGLSREAVDRAHAMFDRAVALTGDEPVLYEVHGNFLQAVGDLPGAIDAWQQAHELIPHDFLPLFQLGVLSGKLGNQDDAQAYLLRVLEIRPALVEAWMELGRSYVAQHKVDAAVEALDQALRYKPDNAGLLSLKGQVFLSAGRAPEAIPLLQRACDINPGALPGQLQLADALVAAGRFPEAARQLEAILQVKPDLIVARLKLGVLLVKQGQLDAGRLRFEEVLAADPENKEAQGYLDQIDHRLQASPRLPDR